MCPFVSPVPCPISMMKGLELGCGNVGMRGQTDFTLVSKYICELWAHLQWRGFELPPRRPPGLWGHRLQERRLARPVCTHATLPLPCLLQPLQPYEKRNVVKSAPYSTPSVDSHTSRSKFQRHSTRTRDFFSLIFVCNRRRPQIAKALWGRTKPDASRFLISNTARPLPEGHMFPDPCWTLNTVDSADAYIYTKLPLSLLLCFQAVTESNKGHSEWPQHCQAVTVGLITGMVAEWLTGGWAPTVGWVRSGRDREWRCRISSRSSERGATYSLGIVYVWNLPLTIAGCGWQQVTETVEHQTTGGETTVYHKVMVIKAVWHWHENRHQRNRIGSTEGSPAYMEN